MQEKLIGTVKWFDKVKGFGFIKSNEKEYFVHYKSIMFKGFKILEENQKVSFLPNQGKKGLMAEQVHLLNPILNPNAL
jgi:CspA family cold shock protein